METEDKAGTLARVTTVLVPAAVGLIASAMLLVDYVRPAPVFCGEGGGCDAVKHTAIAMTFGPILPAAGIVGFLALGTLALIRGGFARGAQVVLGCGGALVALALLGVQIAIRRICPYCTAADLAMLCLGAASYYRHRAKWDVEEGSFRLRLVGETALVAAAALPLAVGLNARAIVPPAIAAELEKAPKGQVCIVDFVDFECPFCRMTHAELEPVLARHHDRIHVIRKQVPLTRIHPHALVAARAACCGETMGQGDAMAESLFATPSEELTPEKCEELAQKLGLPLDAFRSCVLDPKTDDRIKADSAMFRATGGHGLPTIWVDDTKLEGAQPGEELEKAVSGAISRVGS